MPKRLPKKTGALERSPALPKAKPLLIVAMTVRTYDGPRLVEKRLRYREKIKDGLWREYDQAVTMEPEAVK